MPPSSVWYWPLSFGDGARRVVDLFLIVMEADCSCFVGLTALKQQDWTTFSEISTRFSQVNLFDVGREEAAISSCIKHKCVFTFFREALALRVQNHFSSITIKGG